MMKIYRTQDKQLTRVDEIGEGCWVCLNSPDENEARLVASTLDIEPADLMAATDPEESARISLEDGYTLIIVDIPIKVPDSGEGIYTTIPLGIILTQELIVTVCSVDTPAGSRAFPPAKRCGSSTSCSTVRPRCTSRSCGSLTAAARPLRKTCPAT